MHNFHVHNKTIKGDQIFASILHIIILKGQLHVQEGMRLSCTNLKNMPTPIIAVKLLQRRAFTQQPPASKTLTSLEEALIYTPIRDLM